MNVGDLSKMLGQHRDAALFFMLPSGEFIPDHFHITEVGRVQKNFIDCGGTVRESTSCSLQVWTADDVQHRIVAGKLAHIIELAETILGGHDLPVEVEYGVEVASHYFLADVEVTPRGLLFVLAAKQTDCLARDKCGVGNCCGDEGCC